jgi:tyrosine-protein kinase Etk/Wzc
MEVAAVIPVSAGQRHLTRLRRDGLSGPHVLAVKSRRDPAVEALRALRTLVQFAIADNRQARIVLVTGPSEGIGKTFTAENLAILLGQSDKRVLLVDADLRRGRLQSSFGVGTDSSIGLAEVLQETASLDAAIFRDVVPNVDLLGPGRSAREPDELLGKVGITDRIRALAVGYDIVILDSPPILPVSDTTLFSAVADMLLLVVRSGKTTGGEIVETLKRLERAGAPSAHLVFNGLRSGLRSKQYGYYGYRQAYRTPPEAPTTTTDTDKKRA